MAIPNKYGEELFAKDTPTKQKVVEEEDEGVVVSMRVLRPKRIGGVASMCKNFEMKAKIVEK